MVLQVDQPTYADPQAAVAWSASLQTGFHRADQFGLGTLIGRSTGEAFTMSFNGQASSSCSRPRKYPARSWQAPAAVSGRSTRLGRRGDPRNFLGRKRTPPGMQLAHRAVRQTDQRLEY